MTHPLELISDGSRLFEFQGQKLLLTYPSHLAKDVLVDTLSRAAGIPFKWVRAAHENGTSGDVPYAHTHVLVDFGKRFKSKDARRFDVDGFHPNWRPVKSPTHWTNCVAYLAKEDPDNADLRTSSIVRAVWNAATVQDALLSGVKNPGDALGILALFAARPRITPECNVPDRPWQKDVLALLDHKPDPRAIHWFFDPVGNTGKSWLARYLGINKLAYVVKQAGGSRDFATILTNALDAGWDQRCLIFDLPRAAEQHAIWSPMEEAKDGVITSVKYSGRTEYFNSPHLFVFANFPPDRSKMSQDRWRLHTILADGTLERPLKSVAQGETPPIQEDVLPASTPDAQAITPTTGGVITGGLTLLAPRDDNVLADSIMGLIDNIYAEMG